VVTHPKRAGERQLSPFRTWDFDEAVVVLFDDDYKIWRCVSLPCDVIKEHAKYRKQVNGFVARVTDDLLGHPRAVDYYPSGPVECMQRQLVTERIPDSTASATLSNASDTGFDG
jgi:hypothetical protein